VKFLPKKIEILLQNPFGHVTVVQYCGGKGDYASRNRFHLVTPPGQSPAGCQSNCGMTGPM